MCKCLQVRLLLYIQFPKVGLVSAPKGHNVNLSGPQIITVAGDKKNGNGNLTTIHRLSRHCFYSNRWQAIRFESNFNQVYKLN